MKNSFQLTLVGAERSGKTYFARKLADKYIEKKGAVIVYNYGKASDFPDNEYYSIEPLTFNEHIQMFYRDKEEKANYKLNMLCQYFRCRGKIYHFKDFSRYFHKKKVKMFRISNRAEETAFFKAVYLYISKTLVIFDDCKVTFNYGLKDGHVQLFSRKNHTGNLSSIQKFRGSGVDVITIWHNVDHVNRDLWDFTSALVLFKFQMIPNFKNMDNEHLIKVIRHLHQKLLRSPQYTAFEIKLNGVNALKFKNVTIK